MPDLSDVVLECAVPIDVTRWNPPVIVKGRKQGRSTCSTFRMPATVTPASQKALQRLPEGTRAQGSVEVYSKERLYTIRQAQGIPADTFCYNEVTYEVHAVDDWFDLGGYYHSTAVRVDR